MDLGLSETQELLKNSARDFLENESPEQLVRDMDRDGYRWSSLVLGIVNSQPFQMRRVSTPEDGAAVAAGTVAQRW